MKQTIEQLIFLAQRVREVMTNAPEEESVVTPLISATSNIVLIFSPSTKFEAITITKGEIKLPYSCINDIEKWADLATDEFNANEGRLRKRNSEWLAAKIKNAEKELKTLKEAAI